MTIKPGLPSLTGIKDPEIRRALTKFKEHLEISDGVRGDRNARSLTPQDLNDRFEKVDGFLTQQGENFRLSDKATGAIDTPNIKDGAISNSVQSYLVAGIALTNLFQTIASVATDHISGKGIEIRACAFLRMSVGGAAGTNGLVEIRIAHTKSGVTEFVWGPHDICEQVVQVNGVRNVSSQTFSYVWTHIPDVGGNLYSLQARAIGTASSIVCQAYARNLILREDKV